MPRKLTKTWYNSFVDCAFPHSEAPKSYLYWAAFSLIGGILKNHVYFKDGLFTIYPNQYIILTGPPAIGKGTAINFAWSLVKDSKLAYPLANTISDRATPEGIIKVLANGWPIPPVVAAGGQLVTALREHTCTLFSAELRALLTSSDWMLDFLCQTWDQGKYEHTTKNQGVYKLDNLCTSLIGATVPDFVRSMEKDIDMTVAGGFSSRCLYIFEERKSKELPFAQPIQENQKSADLYGHLKEDLEYVAQNVRGEYTMSMDAKIKFSNFYPNISPQPDDSDAMANFKGRMKTHIFKLAMVMSAARKDDLVLDGLDMQNAIDLILGIQKRLDRVFRGVGNSRLAEATAKVLTTVEKHSMISKRELQRILCVRHITTDDLDKALWLLKEVGHIREIPNGKVVYYALPKNVVPIQGATGTGGKRP